MRRHAAEAAGTQVDGSGLSLRRRRVLIGAAVAGIAIGAVVVVALHANGGTTPRAQGTTTATATAAIERRDLVETDTVDGTLGYADERDVPTTLAGTLTWLPRSGAAIRQDHRLFQVDGENVYLLDGKVPAWRTLGAGIEGDDVLQLEDDLRELGYDPYGAMTVDGEWDAGTTAAVTRWQEAHELDETGSIELGRVVFQPGVRRVASLAATLGGTTGGSGGESDPTAADGRDGASGGGATAATVMTTTSTRRIVSVEVSPSKVELARRGARVQVELPSGDVVDGRIASIARVAVLPDGEDATSSEATVTVTIRLARGAKDSRIDQAPVNVLLERSREDDVLAIPTNALLAQAGGGFAVELRQHGQRRIVPVRTGLTASGFVAIEGAGLRAGMRVTVGAL